VFTFICKLAPNPVIHRSIYSKSSWKCLGKYALQGLSLRHCPDFVYTRNSPELVPCLPVLTVFHLPMRTNPSCQAPEIHSRVADSVQHLFSPKGLLLALNQRRPFRRPELQSRYICEYWTKA
jgi:hypothetical protein